MENLKRVNDFLDETKCYFIATIDGNKPRVRAFGTNIIFNGKLYIQTGKDKNVTKQIKANPNVEICAFNGSKWLRVSCELVNDNNHDVKVAMLDKMPTLKSAYNPDDDSMEMFYFKDATATFSSFTEAPESFNF